jgi:hypothetical protein
MILKFIFHFYTQDYLQVVVYNAKESKLRSIRKWLFGVPMLIGSIMGLSSIPFIQGGIVGCQLIPPIPLVPAEVLRALGMQYMLWPFIAFMLVPGYLAIAYSTLIILYMLYRMKQVDQNAKKWIISQHTPKSGRKVKRKETALTKLRREVFRQCVQYLAAVYVTWLFYLTMSLEAKHIMTSNYGLWILLYFVSGIQGFLNCMVYFRPRLARYWRKWRKETQERAKVTKGDNGFNTSAQYSNGTMMSTETWDQIAQIEPAVDIIADSTVSKGSSMLKENTIDVENSKEKSELEKTSDQKSLKDRLNQMEDITTVVKNEEIKTGQSEAFT